MYGVSGETPSEANDVGGIVRFGSTPAPNTAASLLPGSPITWRYVRTLRYLAIGDAPGESAWRLR